MLPASGDSVFMIPWNSNTPRPFYRRQDARERSDHGRRMSIWDALLRSSAQCILCNIRIHAALSTPTSQRYVFISSFSSSKLNVLDDTAVIFLTAPVMLVLLSAIAQLMFLKDRHRPRSRSLKTSKLYDRVSSLVDTLRPEPGVFRNERTWALKIEREFAESSQVLFFTVQN